MESVEDLVAALSVDPAVNETLDDVVSIGTADLGASEAEDDYLSDAQKHWDENIRQLENAVFFILCPVIGRVLGRRFAQNLWFAYCDYRWKTKGQALVEMP